MKLQNFWKILKHYQWDKVNEYWETEIKIEVPDVVTQACNPSTQEAKAGGSQV